MAASRHKPPAPEALTSPEPPLELTELTCRAVHRFEGKSLLARAFTDKLLGHRAESVLSPVWAAAIAVLLVVAIDSTIATPLRDQSVFIYVTEGLLDGEIPYLDRWDHKGPLIYLIYAVGLLLAGIPGIWLVGGVFLTASTWFAYKTTRAAFGATAGFFSVATFLIYVNKFSGNGNFTEQYALLFQFVALLLFLKLTGGSGREVRLPLAIGALGAGAFLLRGNLIGVWLAIGLYWIIRRDIALRWIAWSTVGGIAVLLAVSIAFLILGAWSAFWDAVIVYNFAYVDASLGDRVAVLGEMRRRLVIISLPLAAAWIAGLYYWLSGRTRSRAFEHLLPLALILGPIEVALIALSGFPWGHYYLAILPVSTVLIAFLARFLIEQRLVAPILLSSALLLWVLYYLVPYRRVTGLIDKYAHVEEINVSVEDRLIADRIKEETDSDDSILVWGAEPQIYSRSERDAPTRFFYQYPLVKPGYANQTNRNEFISDIVDSRPTIIVDTENWRLSPLDPVARKAWRPTDRRYLHDPGTFKRFFEFVDTEYEVLDEVSGNTLYRLKERN